MSTCAPQGNYAAADAFFGVDYEDTLLAEELPQPNGKQFGYIVLEDSIICRFFNQRIALKKDKALMDRIQTFTTGVYYVPDMKIAEFNRRRSAK